MSQLEILFLLRERGGHWSPSAVAEELRTTSQSAELRLRDLELRGMAKYEARADAYVYAPRTERLRALVDDVASCYVTMRYTIIDLIFSEPGDSARTPAEEADFTNRKSE